MRETMLTRFFMVFASLVVLVEAQAPNSNRRQIDEAGFRRAVQAGLPYPETLAGVFAIENEDIAIPILVDAVKAKWRDEASRNAKATVKFTLEAVDLITYNANPRAVDAVAELCQLERQHCEWMVKQLLTHGTAQQHPFSTAYDIVERRSELSQFVLPWVEEKTTNDSLMATRLARELLNREMTGRPISDNDIILQALQPATRRVIDQAILSERIERRRQTRQ
jgi:hypothetical protein